MLQADLSRSSLAFALYVTPPATPPHCVCLCLNQLMSFGFHGFISQKGGESSESEMTESDDTMT